MEVDNAHLIGIASEYILSGIWNAYELSWNFPICQYLKCKMQLVIIYWYFLKLFQKIIVTKMEHGTLGYDTRRDATAITTSLIFSFWIHLYLLRILYV